MNRMTEFPKLSMDILEEGIVGYHEFMSDNIEDLNHEKYLFDEVGKIIRQQQYITLEQLEMILHWRQPTFPHHYRLNDRERLKVISKQAFTQDDEEIKTHILTLIKGVAIPSASKILIISFPEKYITLNPMAWEVLQQWKYLDGHYSITPNSWMKYLSTARTLMKRFDLSGTQLDQALIAIHLKYNMQLNLRNFIPLDQFF